MLITDLSEAHIEKVCALFSTVFGADRTPEVWRWKYQSTAHIGAINLVAHDTNGDLVGHVGAIILPGTAAQGRSIPVAQVCDIMVAPSARGGLGGDEVYPRLMQAMRSSLASRYQGAYAFGFPGKRPFRLGERLGFYWRIEDVVEFCHPVRRSALSFWSVDSLDWDSQHIDRIEQRAASMRDAPTAIRNRTYLDWRYRLCPGKTYTLLRFRWAFRSVGWVVVAGEGDVLRVIDSALPDHEAASLITALAGWALRKGFSEIVTWLKTPNVDVDARDAGIVATEFGVQLPMGRYRPVFQPGDVDIF